MPAIWSGRVLSPMFAVVGLVKLLRPAWRPHAVDLHDDEAKLRERLRIAAGR